MEFTQDIGMLQGRLRVVVGDDDVLVFRHEKFLNKTEHRFLLDGIDPQFDIYKSFSVGALVFFLVFFVLAVVSGGYGLYISGSDVEGYRLFAGVASWLMVAAVISGVKAYRSKINLICFNDVNGRRAFSLLGNKPGEAEVVRFCESLKKRIERIRYSGEISHERMAAILERHVEFLHEQNVLSEQEVQAAMERIREKQKPKIISLREIR